MDFRMHPCDAWSLACESMQAHADRFAGAGLTTAAVASPERSVVVGDADRLRQVFTNLFENAARYSDDGGRVELHGTVAGEHLHLIVDDSPPGVPAQALAHLGERFFRVESSRSRQSGGSGLGLALSRKIVEAHGGRLEFAASPLGGLRATVVLRLVAT
jgi:two-component system sensor histidine kinase BaeS